MQTDGLLHRLPLVPGVNFKLTIKLLYFAYGSNMSSLRLRARVPSARVECVATLAGHDLRFHKVSQDGSAKCDAFASGNSAHSVMGVVYLIEATEKAVLDEFEGVGSGYEQKTVQLFISSRETIEAFTYQATHIDPTLKPYHWYKHHVVFGARENNLPSSHIERISAFASIPDPDPARHEKEMAIYG